MAALLPSSSHRFTLRSALHVALLLVAAVFFSLHAVHIDADFPNHSPWMDWSKYTDEGWYGDGAIRYFQRGHWYVPGDFNPAVALPVWPFLESLVFRFTGVTLTAARALTVATFALILIAAYLLLRRWVSVSRKNPGAPFPASSLAPAIAVLLLAVSPFCFVFTRLAILEPFLILLTLLALLAVSYIDPSSPPNNRLRRLLPSVLLGLLVPLMVLTKTTAVFLLPAIAWLLWARTGYRIRPFIRIGLLPGAIAAAVWLTYYLALVRPHFLEDYRYLFAANAYTGITASTAITIFSDTIRDGLWMGPLIYPLSLLAILVAVPQPPPEPPQPADPRAHLLGRRIRPLPRVPQQPPAPVLPGHRRPPHFARHDGLRRALASRRSRPRHPSPCGEPPASGPTHRRNRACPYPSPHHPVRRPPDPHLRPHPRIHLHQRRRPDPAHHRRRPPPRPPITTRSSSPSPAPTSPS